MSPPKRQTLPQRTAIVKAQRNLIDTLDSSVQEDPLWTCWACHEGFEPDSNSRPTRAHIVADANGGANQPGNFFLLCNDCHRDQPDRLPREAQIQWLRERPSFVTLSYLRILKPAMDALTAEAEMHGDKELLNRWIEGRRDPVTGEIDLKALWKQWTGSGMASTSKSNFYANLTWTLLSDFRAWIQSQKTQS